MLVLVLLIGAWLRFAQLSQRGLLFFDEGVYVLGARLLRGWWLTIVQHGWDAAQTYLAHPDQWRGLPSQFAKPGHDLVLCVAMLVGGPSLLSALRVVALLGTLLLPAVYWVGRRWFDAWTGLIAAGMLAVSTYQLTYARSALAETEAMLWFLLALGLVAPSRAEKTPSRARWLISGVLGGLAFLSNYRLWMIPLCLWIMVRARTRSVSKKCLALLTVGFVAPILGGILIDQLLFHAMPSFLAPTYLGQLLYRYGKHVPEGFGLAGWWTYPYIFWSLDGALISLVCGAGLIGLLRQRASPVGRALAMITLLVIGFFSLFHTHHARYISAVLPLVALAGAWAVVTGLRWLLRRQGLMHREPWALSIATVMLLVWHLPGAIRVTQQHTAYNHVVPVLNALAPGDHSAVMSTQPYLLQVFGGRRYVPPLSDEALRAKRRHGLRYFVVDYQLAFGGFDQEASLAAQRLVEHLQPVVVLANPAGALPAVEFEHVTDVAVTRRRLEDPGVRAMMGSIAIYDLAQPPGMRSEK